MDVLVRTRTPIRESEFDVNDVEKSFKLMSLKACDVLKTNKFNHELDNHSDEFNECTKVLLEKYVQIQKECDESKQDIQEKKNLKEGDSLSDESSDDDKDSLESEDSNKQIENDVDDLLARGKDAKKFNKSSNKPYNKVVEVASSLQLSQRQHAQVQQQSHFLHQHEQQHEQQHGQRYSYISDPHNHHNHVSNYNGRGFVNVHLDQSNNIVPNNFPNCTKGISTSNNIGHINTINCNNIGHINTINCNNIEYYQDIHQQPVRDISTPAIYEQQLDPHLRQQQLEQQQQQQKQQRQQHPHLAQHPVQHQELQQQSQPQGIVRCSNYQTYLADNILANSNPPADNIYNKGDNYHNHVNYIYCQDECNVINQNLTSASKYMYQMNGNIPIECNNHNNFQNYTNDQQNVAYNYIYTNSNDPCNYNTTTNNINSCNINTTNHNIPPHNLNLAATHEAYTKFHTHSPTSSSGYGGSSNGDARSPKSDLDCLKVQRNSTGEPNLILDPDDVQTHNGDFNDGDDADDGHLDVLAWLDEFKNFDFDLIPFDVDDGGDGAMAFPVLTHEDTSMFFTGLKNNSTLLRYHQFVTLECDYQDPRPIKDDPKWHRKLASKSLADLMRVDEEGDTLLMSAVVQENYGLVKPLLDRYKREGRLHEVINFKNAMGKSALVYAVEVGNHVVICLLIDMGADVNITIRSPSNTGFKCQSLLGYYISKETVDMNILIELLKCPDINVNDPDTDGCTPLHIAISKFDSRSESSKLTIDHLIFRGADVNAQNPKNERTPLHYALLAGDYFLLDCLFTSVRKCYPDQADAKIKSMLNPNYGFNVLKIVYELASIDTSTKWLMIKLLLLQGAELNQKSPGVALRRELMNNPEVAEIIKTMSAKKRNTNN